MAMIEIMSANKSKRENYDFSYLSKDGEVAD